jgi:DHA1 family multidrug resistance protein B-like MFS transporter
MVVLFQFIVTRIAGRYHITTSMAAGMAVNAIGFVLIALSNGFLTLLGCVAIITIGELFYLPSFTTMSANLSPADKRGRYLGLSGLASVAGFGVGALAGGWALEVLSDTPVMFWAIMAP